MSNIQLYTQEFMEHVSHPDYNEEPKAAHISHEGINPSCGDDLVIHLALNSSQDNPELSDAGWTGSGCAVSQASADMMCDLIIGKTSSEARAAAELFLAMIRGEEKDRELLSDKLQQASCLISMAHMPARVKCAELAWHTMKEMLGSEEDNSSSTETRTSSRYHE